MPDTPCPFGSLRHPPAPRQPQLLHLELHLCRSEKKEATIFFSDTRTREKGECASSTVRHASVRPRLPCCTLKVFSADTSGASLQVQLLPPPARLALRTVRGLHRLRRRQQEGRHAEPEPGVWLRLPRRGLAERQRDAPGRRQQQAWLPARDTEQEGPVQRRSAQRAREPERCADRWHHGQGAGSKRCTFYLSTAQHHRHRPSSSCLGAGWRADDRGRHSTPPRNIRQEIYLASNTS